MKQLILILIILGIGTTLFCAFRNSTIDLRQTALSHETALQTDTQLIEQMRIDREEWIQRIRNTRSRLASVSAIPSARLFDPEFSSDNGWQSFSAEQSEKLLAELGFNWNTTGDYLIVSKKSLGGISFNGIKGAKLTGAAQAVLAITPDEKATIEAITEQLRAEHSAWVLAHIQREEPSGDILAKYSLPIDLAFSQNRSNAFVTAIDATLGNERGELLRHYAHSWMQDAGMFDSELFRTGNNDGSTELILKRYKAGDEWQINYTLVQGSSHMSTSISPWQSFPQTFKPLFPGGWRDIAAQEGFELPKAFKKKAGQ